MLRALGAGALLAATGCGPIQYIANVSLEASGALVEAKQMKAEEQAPYEVTAAEEYLHKARELAGYARFQAAVAFGRKATEMAHKASRLAQSHPPGEPAPAPTKK